jgi:hypothetical protein
MLSQHIGVHVIKAQPNTASSGNLWVWCPPSSSDQSWDYLPAHLGLLLDGDVSRLWSPTSSTLSQRIFDHCFYKRLVFSSFIQRLRSYVGGLGAASSFSHGAPWWVVEGRWSRTSKVLCVISFSWKGWFRIIYGVRPFLQKSNFAVSCHYLFSETLFTDRSTKSPGSHVMYSSSVVNTLHRKSTVWTWYICIQARKKRLCEIDINPIPTIEASELLRRTQEPQMERILSTSRVSDAVNPASGQGPTACVERLA